MFDPTEVGLLAFGIELDRQGYARQPFRDHVRFGPATGGPWGRVDGVFITDGDRRVDTTIRPLNVNMGNQLDVEVRIELVTWEGV